MRFALLALLIPSVAFADPASDAAGNELVRAMKRHDAKAIAARLATPFKHDGVWFRDSECATRFALPGVLQTKDRDAFARCFVKLVPQMSTRTSAQRQTVVLTVEPGVELEVSFDAEGQKVRWLGAAGGGNDKGAPMLTAQAFEALRTKGTTLLDDAVRDKLEPELVKANPTSAWIRTCLDENGVSTRSLAWSSTTVTGQVFLHATEDWTFRAYKLPKQILPIRVCSLSLLTYPASKAPATETLPPPKTPLVYNFEEDLESPIIDHALPSIATLQSYELAALARAPLDPKPATPVQLVNVPSDRISEINVCINAKGDVKNVVTMGQQPGDRTRAGKMWRWKFKPYAPSGTATEACALLSFIVTP